MMNFSGLRLAAGAVLLAAVTATGAMAQAPTDAQRNALRSNCSSDFRAHCSGVSPGGMDALVCLENNEASLSSGCKAAVEAIKGPSTPAQQKSETAPAAPAATSASTSATAKPQAAKPQAAAPAADTLPANTSVLAAPMPLREELRIVARSCFGDFNRFCPNLPIGQGNMVRCLKGHAGELSATCKGAMGQAGAF